MEYHNLDSGERIVEHLSIKVHEGRIASGPSGKHLHVERDSDAITLPGVRVDRMSAFVNERRVLVITYDSTQAAGTLGYAVIVRPGCTVGDHYHHRREERIVLLHGRALFRLQDLRTDSPTSGLINLFEVAEPGVCVVIPTGIAHSILANGATTVLQVLASADYDPSDDTHVGLSHL